MVKVRDRFGGMSRFKSGLRCKGWVNNVILNAVTEINYRCNYFLIQVQCKNIYIHNKCIVPNF